MVRGPWIVRSLWLLLVQLSPHARQPVVGVSTGPPLTHLLPSSKVFFFTGCIYNFVITGRRRTLGTGNTILLKIQSCTNSSLEHKTKRIYT